MPPSGPARTTADNWLDHPYQSRSFQRVREFAPSARVANDSGVVSALPVESQDLGSVEMMATDGSTTTVDRQFTATNGEGLVVLRDGVVVYEYIDVPSRVVIARFSSVATPVPAAESAEAVRSFDAIAEAAR